MPWLKRGLQAGGPLDHAQRDDGVQQCRREREHGDEGFPHASFSPLEEGWPWQWRGDIENPPDPIAGPSLQVKTIGELVQYARANPGKATYASSGHGTSVHLSGELFKMMAGVDMVHVPYRGQGPAMTDLIGGQVQILFAAAPGTADHIKTGKLRALAVTTATRMAELPEVPTVAESGIAVDAGGGDEESAR